MHDQRLDPRPAKAPPAIGLALAAFALGAAALISSCGAGSSGGGSGAGGSDPNGAAGTSGAAGSSGVAGTLGNGGSTSAGGNTGTGASGTAGATGAAGTTAGGTAGTSGGSAGTNGGGTAGSNGGTAGRGGTTGSAGTSGGTAGRGGTTGTAGTTATAGRGGTTGSAGTSAAAGRGGTTGSAGTTGTTCNVPIGPRCAGAQAPNPNPFECSFAWGRQSPSGSGSLSSYNYLQMVANWVESGIRADGTFPSCGGCSWLSSRVSGSTLIPVYYAYMIGYYGHMNGLPDQNTNPNGANLATGGAALIKANRQKIIDMYARYAQQTRAVWSSKPLVWFLEGDFIQYTEASQSSPLTMAELGQLAADITCAIKTNMPNAVVAINHTTWNSNEETNSFWCEMRRADYDMVWTTGVGNNGNYIDSAGAPSYYNAATATYAYVHQLTGKTIAVDTSYGASSMSDSWSNQTAAVLNNHITNGVIGVNISSNPPSNYQTLISGLSSQLMTTCR